MSSYYEATKALEFYHMKISQANEYKIGQEADARAGPNADGKKRLDGRGVRLIATGKEQRRLGAFPAGEGGFA